MFLFLRALKRALSTNSIYFFGPDRDLSAAEPHLTQNRLHLKRRNPSDITCEFKAALSLRDRSCVFKVGSSLRDDIVDMRAAEALQRDQ
jgi:hypothetical protein